MDIVVLWRRPTDSTWRAIYQLGIDRANLAAQRLRQAGYQAVVRSYGRPAHR